MCSGDKTILAAPGDCIYSNPKRKTRCRIAAKSRDNNTLSVSDSECNCWSLDIIGALPTHVSPIIIYLRPLAEQNLIIATV